MALCPRDQLVQLTELLDTGHAIALAEVEAYAPGSDGEPRRLVDEYRFEDVLVTGVNSYGVTDNGVSLDFSKFSHGHVTYGDSGEATSVSEGFDFATVHAFDAVAPIPDINFFI